MELTTLINKEPVFLNDWSQSKLEGLEADFEVSTKGMNILFASYSYQDYSGDAFVLVEKDGQLFQVNGSHCSCYGLEGQWELEPAHIDAIKKSVTDGNFGNDSYCGNDFADELKTFLEV